MVKVLRKRGHRPIDLTAIDTTYRPRKGDQTYAIGFPDLSALGTIASIDTFETFQSNKVSLPVVSVGHCLENGSTNNFIISDAFVYHGNSGGPLVYNNRLIGIVNGANLEVRKVNDPLLQSIYFLNGNKFVYANQILPLLRDFVGLIRYNRSRSPD